MTAELDAMHRQYQELEQGLQRQREDSHSSNGPGRRFQTEEESSPDDKIREESSRRHKDSTAPSRSHSPDALNSRDKVIQNLEIQLDQARREQEQAAEAYELLESVQKDLAKELERTAELTSILNQQESRILILQEDLDVERENRTRESATQNRRVAELQGAYDDQVKKNHEQYLELEEAMDDREAKFSERIAELESACEQKQQQITLLEEEASQLRVAESVSSTLRADLDHTKGILAERESQFKQLAQSNDQHAQQITRQNEVIAVLKRQAADDVFKTTKQERRIEKLLHDREMLNIAVEQLQIHIKLVSHRPRFASSLF